MSEAVLPLEGRRHVLLAVSGGSDSTALLLLAVKQVKTLSNPPKLTAITVDHALRAESAAEAKMAASLCARLGVPHIASRWDGEKPLTGIQEAARDARRALIAQAAGQTGADLVLTGHTLDDQRETVAMRARRGSGPGLAGIAPASLVFDDAGDGTGVWFARPLLNITRQGLRDILDAEAVGWIDDPSNSNTGYERIAMRHRLAEMSAETIAGIDQNQKSASLKRRAEVAEAAQLLPAAALVVRPGLLFIERAFFADDSSDGKLLALRTLLSFAAATPHLADGLHAKVLFDAAASHPSARGAKAERLGAGGVLAEIRARGVYLLQERRRGAVSSKAFAGRYRLLGRRAGPVSLQRLPQINASAPAALVRHAELSEPLCDMPDAGSLSAAEAVRKGCALRLLLNPWPDLVPSFDIELAEALAKITDSRPFPALAL